MSQESIKIEENPFTEADQAELSLLERLQTSHPESIDGIVWNPAIHFPRILELKKKREGGLTEEQKRRYVELSKSMGADGPGLKGNELEEFKTLQAMKDRERGSPSIYFQ